MKHGDGDEIVCIFFFIMDIVAVQASGPLWHCTSFYFHSHGWHLKWFCHQDWVLLQTVTIVHLGGMGPHVAVPGLELLDTSSFLHATIFICCARND